MSVVDEVEILVLLRDFDTAKLTSQADLLHTIAAEVQQMFVGLEVAVTVTEQYRNLAEGLAREPRAAGHARTAWERLGRTPIESIIRGGTDGSRLTELGLPTPNLSTGQHNPHSRLEWACLEEMHAAVAHLVELAQVWATPPSAA